MKKQLLFSSVIKHCVVLLAGTTLWGCGGGLTNEPGRSSTPAAPVNESLFSSVSAYCKTDAIKTGDPKHDGWTSLPTLIGTPDQYGISAIYSTSGSTSNLDSPINMHVSRSDYRGVRSTVVPSGFGKPDWIMGARLPTLLAPRAVACTTQVSRINYPSPSLGNMTIAASGKPVAGTPVLYWRSFWNQDVPVAQLSGYLVDGFEFVADFAPLDGQVYFTLDKTRFASPQSMSICYLAPGGAQWDCQQPTLADQGANWQLFQHGLKQGVYVLTSPTLQ